MKANDIDGKVYLLLCVSNFIYSRYISAPKKDATDGGYILNRSLKSDFLYKLLLNNLIIKTRTVKSNN